MTDRATSILELLTKLESGQMTKEQVQAQLQMAQTRGFELGHTGTKVDTNGTLRDKMTVYGARSQGRPMEFSDAEWNLIEEHFEDIKKFRAEKLPELREKAKADREVEIAKEKEEAAKAEAAKKSS